MAFDRLVGWDSGALVLPPLVVTYLDARYVNATGPDTLTGNYTITGTLSQQGAATFSGTSSQIIVAPSAAGTARVDIRANGSGNLADIIFRTGTLARWGIGKNNAAESGANAGSDFDVDRYNDAGSFLGTVLTISRATGVVAFTSSPTAPTQAPNTATTQLATTAFVDQLTKGGAAARQTLPAAETYVMSVPILAGELTATTRYRMILNFSNPATASTSTIRVKYGAAGTTADATIHTATYTGTAAADAAQVIVDVGIDTINASTGQITSQTTLQRNVNGTTGFHNVAGNPTANTQTGSLDTTAARFLGVSIQETAATTVLLHGSVYKVTH